MYLPLNFLNMFKDFIFRLFKIKPSVFILVVKEKKEISDEGRLDNDPKFSGYATWAGKMALKSPGTQGVDG